MARYLMKLDLPVYTFNSFGGGSRFGSVIALVELNEDSFGEGLEAIEMQMFCKSALPFEKQRVNRSLQDDYDRFHTVKCAALPMRRFMRKKRKLRIDALVEFATAEQMRAPAHPLNLEWQAAALDMLIRELEACRKKFTPAVDFHFGDFLEWLRQQYDNLPATQDEAQKLDQRWRDADDEKQAQMDEWESLGIDWEDYHESAREIVADSRLWSQGHDFAPNGNDNGADVLYSFRSEKSRWARGGGKTFYKNLARDWGFDPKAEPGDSIDYQMKREAIVGLAFAFLKLFGYCPEWLADETMQTIENYKTFLATRHLDWPHRHVCLEYQNAMLDCLNACPRRSGP